MAAQTFIDADPYRWPYNGKLDHSNTCLVVIDMQVDFCSMGGYVDSMGYDITLLRKPIEPIRQVLDCMRRHGYHIIFTREGHRPDLSDLNENKRWRTSRGGAEIGSPGPCGRFLVRGEPGWDIIPELAPRLGEPIVDKPGRGSFVHTDLDLLLRSKSICNLIFVGVTTDVCVHSTMRHADDLGYECLLLEDCCAATVHDNHVAAVNMIKTEGGVFGSVSDSSKLLAAIGES